MRIVVAIDALGATAWMETFRLMLPSSARPAAMILSVMEVPRPRIVTVAAAPGGRAPAMGPEAGGGADAALDAARDTLGPLAGSVVTRITEGPALETILAAAEGWRADLLVVGPGRSGPPGTFLPQGVARPLARRAPCSVLIVGHGGGDIRRVLIVEDGLLHVDRAARWLAETPLPPNVAAHICAGTTPFSIFSRLRNGGTRTHGPEEPAPDRALEEAVALLRAKGCAVTACATAGHPPRHLRESLRTFCPDLAVVAADGPRRGPPFLREDPVEAVVKRAPRSVLILRP